MKKRNDRLRVLIFHDIPPSQETNFESLLKWLSKRWIFVSPEEFSNMICNKKHIKGNNLLITFDDGFLSNYIVAKKVLKPMGIQALFFVVSDFVDIKDKNKALNFIAKNIMPEATSNQLPVHLENMKWFHLSELIKFGHTIGAHTKTHARLSDNQSIISLKEEVIDSATCLEKRLGIIIEHFAFTFGNLESISSDVLNIARDHFKFIHTGIRGNNSKNRIPCAIRRDPINLVDSKWLIGSFLEGVTDKYYNAELIVYESYIS